MIHNVLAIGLALTGGALLTTDLWPLGALIHGRRRLGLCGERAAGGYRGHAARATEGRGDPVTTWRGIMIDGKEYRTDGLHVEVVVAAHKAKSPRGREFTRRSYARLLKIGKTHRDVLRLTRERL